MKLIALYKTWDGGEFVDASLASIYDHVDAIVMVHSEVSWLGERGNTVKPLAVQWCESNDHAGKVHHVDYDSRSQERQYQAGIDYIARHKLPFDAVMVVDADEVWEGVYIENAKRGMSEYPANQSPAYRSAMHTYLKNPFFRVMPPFGSPTTFVRNPYHLTQSPRASRARAVHLSDVWMHHYTYVRETREAVQRKLHQSALGDGGREQVIPGWMENVYDRLPEGENLHGFARHRTVWNHVDKIWTCDLPEAMRSARLLPHWFPPGEFLDGELNAIHRNCIGRDQAVDLGTLFGLSAVTLSLACRRVHTIDAYDQLPPGTFADTLRPERYEGFAGHSLARTQALAQRWGNITCEQGLTQEAARRWQGGPVDVLLVDACHSEQSVTGDVEAWLPHLRTGSRVIFHDDNDIHPGVQAAVRRMRDDPRFRFIDPGEFSGSLAVCEVP